MTMASDFEVEHYLDHQATIFLARFDPHTYLYLSRVMDYFDPFAEHVRAHAGHALPARLVRHATGASAPSTREYIDARAARARRRRAPRTRSRSPWGHDSFLMDVPEYQEAVAAFLS